MLELEDEYGHAWLGTTEQNKEADKRIAANVKSSFRSYEKTKEPHDKAYFLV